METKKDKTMWVVGSTLKEISWEENNAGFVSGSMNMYMKGYDIYTPKCDMTHAEWRVDVARRKVKIL